jgi:hypothetical protein
MTWRREVLIFTKDGVKTVTKTRSRFLDTLVGQPKSNTLRSLDSASSLTRSNPVMPTHSRKLGSIAKNTSQQRSYQPMVLNRHQQASKTAAKNFEGTASVYAKQKYNLPGSLQSNESSRRNSQSRVLTKPPSRQSNVGNNKPAKFVEKIPRQNPGTQSEAIREQDGTLNARTPKPPRPSDAVRRTNSQ